MDLDSLLRHSHETVTRRQIWTFYLLPCLCMDMSSNFDYIWLNNLIYTRCKVSFCFDSMACHDVTHCYFFKVSRHFSFPSCHNLTSLSTVTLRILPNYCATYVLLAAVMIVNPVLYFASTRDLQTAVTCSLAQITSRERKLVQAIKLKFALTNFVYYVCWLPNLINGILLWTLWFQLPVKIIITLWYIMVCIFFKANVTSSTHENILLIGCNKSPSSFLQCSCLQKME